MDKIIDRIPGIAHIRDDGIREVVVKTLEAAPDYFWKIPSSSTGKYHPEYTLGEGGLVRHTRAAMYFGANLARAANLTEAQTDFVLAALAIHDTAKNGLPYGEVPVSKYTSDDHPFLVGAVMEKAGISSIADPALTISRLVTQHMGQWTVGPRKIPIEQYNSLAMIVHFADYLASRREVMVMGIEREDNES